MCTGLSESRQSPDSVQAPAPVADSGLSSTSGQDCISPQLLMLGSVIQSSQSSQSRADGPDFAIAPSLDPNSPLEASQATPPKPANPPASSFDFNSPPELSQSPPTTTGSPSPARNSSSGRRPLTCHHCHIRLEFDVTALVYVSLACPRFLSNRLPC